MATIQIDPVPMISCGGYAVTISGIDPTSSDCFKGSVMTPGAGLKSGGWDLSGIMRDSSEKCNISTQTDQFTDLAALARKLGVPGA